MLPSIYAIALMGSCKLLSKSAKSPFNGLGTLVPKTLPDATHVQEILGVTVRVTKLEALAKILASAQEQY